MKMKMIAECKTWVDKSSVCKLWRVVGSDYDSIIITITWQGEMINQDST